MGLIIPTPCRQPLCPGWEVPPSPAMAPPCLAFASTDSQDCLLPRPSRCSPCGRALAVTVAPVGTGVRTSHGSQCSLPAHMVNSRQAVEEGPGAGCPEPATPLSSPRGPGPREVSSEQLGALPEHFPPEFSPPVSSPSRCPGTFLNAVPASFPLPHVLMWPLTPRVLYSPITAWGRISSPPPPGPPSPSGPQASPRIQLHGILVPPRSVPLAASCF